MEMGQVITIVLVVGFFIVFGLVMFWVYGLTPFIHWFIKSNGEQARAVILEVRTAGWGWYAGGRYSETLIFQPVTVKLEVHPNNGAPYIAQDRFNAKRREYRDTLKPGAELQVTIARFNPQWVASWPETAVLGAEPKHEQRVPYGSGSAAPAGALAPKQNNFTMVIVLGVVSAFLCICLAGLSIFAYSRYVTGQAVAGLNIQVATAAPVSGILPTSVPASASNAGTVPDGGLGDQITRATAWGNALAAILQGDPTRCISPDGAQTTIKVTHPRNSSGAWQERWTVACDGASSIPVDIAFTPAGGGQFTVKATVVK